MNIPDNLDINNKEASFLLATKLYEQGKLSVGQATELAGITKRVFVELLGTQNVSIFNYSASELERDVSNA